MMSCNNDSAHNRNNKQGQFPDIYKSNYSYADDYSQKTVVVIQSLHPHHFIHWFAFDTFDSKKERRNLDNILHHMMHMSSKK